MSFVCDIFFHHFSRNFFQSPAIFNNFPFLRSISAIHFNLKYLRNSTMHQSLQTLTIIRFNDNDKMKTFLSWLKRTHYVQKCKSLLLLYFVCPEYQYYWKYKYFYPRDWMFNINITRSIWLIIILLHWIFWSIDKAPSWGVRSRHSQAYHPKGGLADGS